MIKIQDTQFTTFIKCLESLQEKITWFYDRKKGKAKTELEKIHLSDLRWMLSKNIEVISRIKYMNQPRRDALSEKLEYEIDYLKDLELEGINNYSVALIQAKNVMRSAYDIWIEGQFQ